MVDEVEYLQKGNKQTMNVPCSNLDIGVEIDKSIHSASTRPISKRIIQ